MTNFLQDLTAPQCSAVTSTHPQILCVAGPGSGKTKTLTTRIANLVQNGADPKRICVITFTNAGARELRERLERFGVRGLGYVGTLHGFCLRLLQRWGAGVGYRPGQGIQVLDEAQAALMLGESIAHVCAKFTEQSLEAAKREFDPLKEPRSAKQQALSHYYRRMRAEGLVDFDTIVRDALRLIKTHKGVIDFAHLLVDEVQDSADIDFAIYRAMGVPNCFFVGDPDQAIYGFRGGNVRHIVHMANDCDVEVIRLERNFRCSGEICQAANFLIRHNLLRVPKDNEGGHWNGLVPEMLDSAMPGEEVARIMALVKTDLANGTPAHEIAILARSNSLAAPFLEAAKVMGLPVRARAKKDLPKEWHLARLAVELLANPCSDRAGYQWIAETKGNDAAQVAKKEKARAMRIGYADVIKAPISTTAETLPYHLARLGIGMAEIERVTMIRDSLDEPDLTGISLAMASVMEPPEEGDGIAITTMHASKGREWKHVYLVGLEKETLPGGRKELELEEERRIMFVAITRAKSKLVGSWCRMRKQTFGRMALVPMTVSQFVAEAGL